MELRCVECETEYEFDQFSVCPKCNSDKSNIVSLDDPFPVKRIMKYRFWTVIIGTLGYFILKAWFW